MELCYQESVFGWVVLASDAVLITEKASVIDCLVDLPDPAGIPCQGLRNPPFLSSMEQWDLQNDPHFAHLAEPEVL